MQYGVKSLLFYYKGGDILYIFLKSNNFDFGCNELVILRLDILKQLFIIADMLQDKKVEIPHIIEFIARVFGYKSPTYRV